MKVRQQPIYVPSTGTFYDISGSSYLKFSLIFLTVKAQLGEKKKPVCLEKVGEKRKQ